jgi:hypothetical protein
VKGSDKVAYTLSADELKTYFSTPATSTGSPDKSHISYRPLIQGDSFSFYCVDGLMSGHWFGRHSVGLNQAPSAVDSTCAYSTV